jgi:hypothetical protein
MTYIQIIGIPKHCRMYPVLQKYLKMGFSVKETSDNMIYLQSSQKVEITHRETFFGVVTWTNIVT